jgi:hypothetical protein
MVIKVLKISAKQTCKERDSMGTTYLYPIDTIRWVKDLTFFGIKIKKQIANITTITDMDGSMVYNSWKTIPFSEWTETEKRQEKLKRILK